MARLNENAVKHITEMLTDTREKKTPLIMILNDIQNEYGYIPLEVQQIVSDKTGISVAEIYGVELSIPSSPLFRTANTLSAYVSEPLCYVKGAQQVIDKFSEILGIGAGQTTEDGLFSQ